MALSNYEKQKRWREKNRARYNLQQRNRRKGIKVNPEYEKAEYEDVGPKLGSPVERFESDAGSTPASSNPTIAALRDLIKQEEEKLATGDLRKPSDVIGGIYRNDQGGVISKFAWEKLQRMKEEAKKGGYEIDEYSQS